LTAINNKNIQKVKKRDKQLWEGQFKTRLHIDYIGLMDLET